MRQNSVKSLWSQNKTASCGWVSCDSPLIAETMGQSRLDAVVVDMQHGMTDLQSLPAMLTALATTAATPFVRLASGAPAEVMKALDAGAYGLICPLVNTAEQAEALVASASYPPRGGRSFGPFRAKYYAGDGYLEHANDTVLTMAMIETSEGFQNLDAILAVEGLDAVFVGPADLALNFGYTPGPEQAYDPLEQAMATILEQSHKVGKHVGIFCSNGAGAALRKSQGFDLVVPSNDTYALARLLKAEIDLINDA